MYEVDEKDTVIELDDVPQSSVGAPIPLVVADEHNVLLAYYLQDTPDDWDGSGVRVVGPDSEDEAVAVVQLEHCTAHMFGPPNDEAFDGHPLYERGLGPYGAYEVCSSSWIRRLERMNAVHPNHDKARFMEGKRHFVFAFHDSTFECIAQGFNIEIHRGSVHSMVPVMLEQMR